jgi:hypothetical protein
MSYTCINHRIEQQEQQLTTAAKQPVKIAKHVQVSIDCVDDFNDADVTTTDNSYKPRLVSCIYIASHNIKCIMKVFATTYADVSAIKTYRLIAACCYRYYCTQQQ